MAFLLAIYFSLAVKIVDQWDRAVLFWRVIDPKKAALEVTEYKNAISWAAQTALRDVIGKTELSDH